MKRAFLTPTELQVLALIAGGCSSLEGSGALGMARATYRNHVSRIMLVLGAHTQAEAVHNAYQLGILQVLPRA